MERPVLVEYYNISGVPVLSENVIFTILECASVIQKVTTLERKMVSYCPMLVYRYLRLKVHFSYYFIYLFIYLFIFIYLSLCLCLSWCFL